jgi:hypothetical protein
VRGRAPAVFEDSTMLPFCSTILRSRLALAGLAGIAVPLALSASIGPAAAQSAECQELTKHLTDRRSLVETIQKLGGKDKKMDPKAACSAFGKLAANGTTTLKWAESNKDWCQVPDQFIQGIRTDHEKVVKLRGQACGVAAKQAEMEKKGRSQGDGPGGLLGGGGLEGSYKIPQGAL